MSVKYSFKITSELWENVELLVTQRDRAVEDKKMRFCGQDEQRQVTRGYKERQE